MHNQSTIPVRDCLNRTFRSLLLMGTSSTVIDSLVIQFEVFKKFFSMEKMIVHTEMLEIDTMSSGVLLKRTFANQGLTNPKRYLQRDVDES